jgi:glycosyltransferase involved in cell wall biosynthesis
MTQSNPGPARIAVVLSHPTQYYSPWFQWIASHTQLRLRVFYLWDFGVTDQVDPKFGKPIRWDMDLLSGYDSEFVPNISRNPGAESFRGFDNPDLGRRLSVWKPDALLVFGYKWLSHVRAIAWGRLHGVPLIFRGDSTLIGRPKQAPHVVIALRLLFSQVAAFLYVGSANRDYFARFGVPARKLFFCPHSVSGKLYNPADGRNSESALKLRHDLGISPRATVILFAGKLVPDKQPMALLQAFLELASDDAVLVFVGDGSEKLALEATAQRSSAVRFLSFANQTQMPARYMMADVFVLPSNGIWETWGLAVNEAMLMGVPCLVSNRVGCQRDLVSDGESGWVFDPEVPEALKAALGRAISDVRSDVRRKQIRQVVAGRIAGYSYEKSTDGLLEAVAAVLR